MLKTFAYADNESLAFCDTGPHDGAALIVFHGLVGSAENTALFDQLTSLRIRGISFERPGYGHSSPYPLKNYADSATLVSALADHLALTRFSLLAISAGAPHAYALAQHDTRVDNIYIYSGLPYFPNPAIMACYPPYSQNFYQAIAPLPATQVGEQLHNLFKATEDMSEWYQANYANTIRQGFFGMGQEAKLQANEDWAFQPAKIGQPVYMQHATEDKMVPFAAAAKTCALFPQSTLAQTEGEHFEEDNFQALLQHIAHTIPPTAR